MADVTGGAPHCGSTDVPADVPGGTATDEVWSRVGSAGRAWPRGACAAVAERPERVRTLFPAAGRHCGRAPLRPGDPED